MAISGTDGRRGLTYHHFAFVPEPLPTDVDLSGRTWTAVSRAAEALGRLSQACHQLPNPSLLIAPALAREAVDTSALEGTYGALPDVLEARLKDSVSRSPEVREIHAYEDMARLAFEWVEDRPISVGMLSELQKVLADGSKNPPRDAGRVRQHQVVIGPENCSVYDARFVPPPAGDQLRAGLDDWQQWVNGDIALPPVVKAAMAHYQFECLHPFSDGNGRVGRLVIVLMLLKSKSLAAPSLSISAWLLRQRQAYQDHLLRVSQTGDWNPWVQFFSTAVSEQCDAHVDVARRLFDWITDLRRQIHERRWGGVITNVSEALIEWPVLSAGWVQERFNVGFDAAQYAIDRLVALDVLVEMTGRSYGRIYGARPVMDIVESL